MATLLQQHFQLKQSCCNLCTGAIKYELFILFRINAAISSYLLPLFFLFDLISGHLIQYFTGDSTLSRRGYTGVPTI